MDMYRGRLSSFGPVCLIHCVSRRMQSHHGALPVWSLLVSVCMSFLGPDSGADGHNEGELTNSARKDGAERALRS